MNPLDTLEKAKEWAHFQATLYDDIPKKIYFVVCKWNEGYIVHKARFIYEHIKEYKSEEIVYCTDITEFKLILITLRLLQNEK